ncbi:Ubiquitin-related modifier 1 [Erysiphe neolycopersici]|uniref:Ubiquitin-related modifier 1 n=1 Tax=Erysiphe neolycopersici TaxID=212602 RepID=A0A420HPS7_9PEZI|nr:Ubiquitin-related modifier 1 [Erysiphe neolycopersici]
MAIEEEKSPSTSIINIDVEFTGGLEMLFRDERKHKLVLPRNKIVNNNNGGDDETPITIGWLIEYLCENLMTDSRKEMFVLDGHVRPGILVLINDADWELCGEVKYKLQPNDNVLFVSTLHGG